MKSVRQRIDRLEDRLAPQATNQILIVVADAAQKLALDGGSCVQILREAGRIDSASPISVVDLGYGSLVVVRRRGQATALDPPLSSEAKCIRLLGCANNPERPRQDGQ